MTSKEIELSKALERTEKVAKPNTVFLHRKSLPLLKGLGYMPDRKPGSKVHHLKVDINKKPMKVIVIPNEEKERFACVSMEIII